MPLPYRPLTKSASNGLAAYLWIEQQELTFYGGLLVTDSIGQPMEFVYSSADSPSSFLWPQDEVRRVAVARIAHVLFDACEKSPSILIASQEIGSADFCREHLGPSIPFVLVSTGSLTEEIQCTPIGEPPSGIANAILNELKRRKLLVEPFARIRSAFTEVFSDFSVADENIRAKNDGNR